MYNQHNFDGYKTSYNCEQVSNSAQIDYVFGFSLSLTFNMAPEIPNRPILFGALNSSVGTIDHYL